MALPQRSPTGAYSRILNKMDVRVRDASDGKEKDFSFINSSVGIREGHKLSIVRGLRKGHKLPLLLMLINHSTGQQEESETGFLKAMSTQGMFGPRWKAGLAAMGIAAASFPLIHYVWRAGEGMMMSSLFALGAGVIMFPAIWAGLSLLDGRRRPQRDMVEAERLRAEIESRLGAQLPAHMKTGRPPATPSPAAAPKPAQTEAPKPVAQKR